jgi:hypothetical protein
MHHICTTRCREIFEPRRYDTGVLADGSEAELERPRKEGNLFRPDVGVCEHDLYGKSGKEGIQATFFRRTEEPRSDGCARKERALGEREGGGEREREGKMTEGRRKVAKNGEGGREEER